MVRILRRSKAQDYNAAEQNDSGDVASTDDNHSEASSFDYTANDENTTTPSNNNNVEIQSLATTTVEETVAYQTAAKKKEKQVTMLAGVLFLIVIIVGIAVGVGMKGDSNKTNNDAPSEDIGLPVIGNNTSFTPSSSPSNNTTFTPSSSPSISLNLSMPTSSEITTISPSGIKDPPDSSSTSTVNNSNTTNNLTDTNQDDETSGNQNFIGSIDQLGVFRTSSNQPIQASIRTFSESSSQGYDSCIDFANDVMNMISIISNNIIMTDSRAKIMDVPIAMEDTAVESSIQSPSMTKNEESSYGTNNQVYGVDEADIVKSTATHTFLAYGDLLIIINLDGDIVSKTRVKRDEKNISNIERKQRIRTRRTTDVILSTPPVVPTISETLEAASFTRRQIDETNNMNRPKEIIGSIIASKPRIKSLLLHQDRLVVVFSGKVGFSSLDIYETPTIIEASGDYGDILHIYDISNIPSDGSPLPHVTEQILQGKYHDGRSVDNMAHIITTSNIDTYYHLSRHLSRWQSMYERLDDSQYIEVAKAHAENVIIPSFQQRLMGELNLSDFGSCSNIMQLSIFQSVQLSKDNTGSDDDVPAISVPILSSLLGGLVQVTSFDILGNYDKNSLEAQDEFYQTSAFLPSTYDSTIYANDSTLIVSTNGYQYNHDSGIMPGSWNQQAYITSFAMTNSGATGIGTGTIPGHILNQYAMDVWDGHLRIASTTSVGWSCREGTINTTAVVSCDWLQVPITNNYVFILQLSSISGTSDTTLEEGSDYSLLVESTARKSNSLLVVGSIDGLGEVGERIEAVRFKEEKGFVVTFRKTDPFYTLDLTNHTNPQLKGELKISGYSNYLHPYDENSDILIAVGQDADERTGIDTGLQISLFNVTDLENPSLVTRYNVEEGEGSNNDSWSNSEAQYEPKAFRFLPLSKILILPVSLRSNNDFSSSFDGFFMFSVTTSEISQLYNVSHVDPSVIGSYCWYDAYLPARSVVHTGVAMTMKGHSIVASNLTSGEKIWDLNLDANNTDCSFMGYWVK